MRDSKAPSIRKTDSTRSASARRATLERRNARAAKRFIAGGAR